VNAQGKAIKTVGIIKLDVNEDADIFPNLMEYNVDVASAASTQIAENDQVDEAKCKDVYKSFEVVANGFKVVTEKFRKMKAFESIFDEDAVERSKHMPYKDLKKLKYL
jgi:hypothetical protein